MMIEENRKNIKRIIGVFIMVLLLMGAVQESYGQVGDDSTPLFNSTHTYSVTKSNASSTGAWDIYAKDVDTELEAAGATAYLKGTDYTVSTEVVLPGIDSSYITIVFDKSAAILPGDTCMLAYYERTGESCEAYRFYQIVLCDTFDVDIALVSTTDVCPDDENVPFESAPTAYQTSLDYVITLQTDYVNTNSETWSFNWQIDVSSSGTAATIDSVIFTIVGSPTPFDINPDVSTYISPGVWIESATNTSIAVRVVINDVLGADQQVRFELTGITGVYYESDADKDLTGDFATYNLNKMPNAGYITALN